MADDRTYIRVHDGLDENHKIEGLSDKAFRLLITLWCYCSRNRNDGRIAIAAWRKRGTAGARRELVDAGLVDEHETHVEMHDYLQHQRSAEEIALLQSTRGDTGAYGNHVRWHVVRRKPKKDCSLCFPSGSQMGSQTDRKPIASTEAEAEEKYFSKGGSHVSSGHGSAPPRFPDHCTRHADVPIPGKCGDCKDTREANRYAAEQLPDYRLMVVPPLCGSCDERWIETPSGLAKCPRCYPTEARTA